MAGESAEQLIINRLAQAPSFHPSGAKLFVPDWTLDPGDVVTVQSDGESYDVPIYSLDLSWNGACRADIQSTGNQQREPLSALRRKEYQAGRRGYGQFKEIDDEFKEFETWQEQTDEVIGTYAAQFVDILGDGTNEGRLTLAETAIEHTASDATITAQAAGILLDEDGHPILDERGKYQYDPNAADTTLIAQINTNATEILAKVSQSDLNTTLASYLQINAFSTELASTLDNGDTTLAAKIITAVNKNTNTSSVVISADQINLDGVVNSTQMDTRLLNVDNLFSSTGYSESITVKKSVNAGSVYADNFYFRQETGTDPYQMHTRLVYLLGDNSYLTNISAVTIGSAESLNLRHSHAITITALTGNDEGKIQVQLGEAVATNSADRTKNFNIADTAFYKSHVGISTVAAAGWTNDGEGGGYYNIVTATANDSTQQNPDTMDVNVVLPTITVRPDLGTNASGTVKAYGPVVDGSDYQVSTAATLYLKADENYCYITSNNNTPTVSNIVAQIANPGGGTVTVNDWGLTHQTGTDYTYKASVNINGTPYESGNLDATEAYNNGWTGAYQSVGIFPTAVADLVPGGSPITIYAQAKATSGSAKSNVASVQVKARALNLKNETFSVNDTYTVPSGYDGYGTITVSVPDGGGGNRTVQSIYPDTITLDDEETETSEHILNAYYTSGTDTTPVTVKVDASAVFSAGVTQGMGGTTVDVVKNDWVTSISNMNLMCRFSPSAGDGEEKSVLIKQSPVRNQSSSTGTVNLTDYDENIGSVTLNMSRSGDQVILRHLKNPIVTPSTIASGTPIAVIDVPSSGPTIVSDVDKIVQIGNIEYSSDYKTATIAVQAQDSYSRELLTDNITTSVESAWEAGRTVGISEGSGLQIEEDHYELITDNNTTVSVFPTRPNNVMSSASIRVEVPVNEGISGAALLASVDSSDTYDDWQLDDDTELSKKYGFIQITGKDGSTYSYGIDASKVYRQGMIDGSGGFTGFSYEGTAIGNVQTDHEYGNITVSALNGSTVLDSDTLSVYLTQGQWNSSNRKAVNIRMADGSNTLIARTWVDAPTVSYDTPSISCTNWSGGSPTASKTITVANNSTGFITVTATANGKTSPGYIIVIKHS